MEGLPRPGYLEDDEKHDRLAALGVGNGQWAIIAHWTLPLQCIAPSEGTKVRKQFLYSPEVVWTIKKQNSRQVEIGLVKSKHNLHNCIKEASPLQKGSGDNRKTKTKDNRLHKIHQSL